MNFSNSPLLETNQINKGKDKMKKLFVALYDHIFRYENALFSSINIKSKRAHQSKLKILKIWTFEFFIILQLKYQIHAISNNNEIKWPTMNPPSRKHHSLISN